MGRSNTGQDDGEATGQRVRILLFFVLFFLYSPYLFFTPPLFSNYLRTSPGGTEQSSVGRNRTDAGGDNNAEWDSGTGWWWTGRGGRRVGLRLRFKLNFYLLNN